jgi:hypothetical protein
LVIRGSLAGTSGHDEYQERAGHHTFMPRTSVVGARPKRVRIPRHPCRGPAALANEAGSPESSLTLRSS